MTSTTTAITFAQYMERALYGPEGYYAAGTARSGRGGDYFTAPDTGPVFGRLLAAIFVEWNERLGANPLHLVEVGAGEGALAKSILSSSPAVVSGGPRPGSRLTTCRDDGIVYTAVERSPARRKTLETLGLPI